MTAFISSNFDVTRSDWKHTHEQSLLRGEIVLTTHAHSIWGGAVTAQMYLPLSRLQAWQQLTDYPRWVQYFPDLTHSEVLSIEPRSISESIQDPGRENRETLVPPLRSKRLYQAASKSFLLLRIQVEAYLKVVEVQQQQIQFRLERGSFNDFSADLKLQDCERGTVLIYSVQATPCIPVPGTLIQEAMRLDLPNNMRQMRRVLCGN